MQAARSEEEPADGFRFLYFTDTHIQPELDAADGCRMCYGRMAHEPAEFAICGGDLVFAVLAVDRSRNLVVRRNWYFGSWYKRRNMSVWAVFISVAKF